MNRWRPEHGKYLVCVHWKDADASSPTEAFYEEELDHSATLVETYGLLVKEEPGWVTLMTETYKESDGKRVFRGRTRIPRALIERVEIISTPWKPKSRKKRNSGVETTPQQPRLEN